MNASIYAIVEFLAKVGSNYQREISNLKRDNHRRNMSYLLDISLSTFLKLHVEVDKHVHCRAGTSQLRCDLMRSPCLMTIDELATLDIESMYAVTYQEWLEEMFDPSKTVPGTTRIEFHNKSILLSNIVVLRNRALKDLCYVVFPSFVAGNFKPARARAL